MAQETDIQLTAEADVIQNETTAGANTKTRIATLYKNIIDSKINNDQVDSADTLDTAGTTIPGKTAVKNYIANEINSEASARNTAIGTAISDLIAGAPANLDTLDALAAAIGDDPAYAATIAAALAALTTAITTTNKVLVTGAVTLDSTAFGKEHVCSGTSADYTIILPTAVGNEGKMLCFKGDPLSANLNKAVTIDGAGTELIDSRTTTAISTGGHVTLIARVTSGVGSWDILSFDQGSYIFYTPTVTGFSSTPSTTNTRYRISGKVMFLVLDVQLTTSNATTFTFTLPTGISGASSKGPVAQVANSSAYVSTPGLFICNGSNIVSLHTSPVEGVWTASGTKGVLGVNLVIPII